METAFLTCTTVYFLPIISIAADDAEFNLNK